MVLTWKQQKQEKELHESRLQCLHLFGCALLLRCGAEVPRAILFSQPLVNAELVYRCVSWKEPRTSAQLGSPPGHYDCSCGSEEDWLRCLQCFCGLVLGQLGCRGSSAVDAANGESLGDTGLCDFARALYPHQKAHQQSACSSLRVSSHSLKSTCPSAMDFHSRQEVDSHPCHLHHPPHLEHCALHTDALQLPCSAKFSPGCPAWNWKHVSRRCQLHYVCPLHACGPGSAAVLHLLLSPR